MNIKKHIPNTITCGNLLCGCLAIVQTFTGNLAWTAYLVGIALVLDFFDGFTARKLKVASPIGKDLDSLADMVTFGVVPGIVMFQLLNISLKSEFIVEPRWHTTVFPLGYLANLGFIITIFSAIRLAKFNNDTRQTDSFIGVPTPANAMLVCSLPLICQFQPELNFITGFIANPWFLAVLTCLMSFLLVSEIPLFALKFKNFSWATNKLAYCFLIVSILLILALHFMAIPLIILLYILVSIVNNIFLKSGIKK